MTGWLWLLACGGGIPLHESETESVEDTEVLPLGALTLTEHEDVATVLWAHLTLDEAATDVQVFFETADGVLATPTQDLDAGDHILPLLGIPSETEVTAWAEGLVGRVRVTESVTGSTGALPDNLTDATALSFDHERADPDRWVLTSVDVGEVNFGGPCYTVLVDRQGRVVWYRSTSQSRLTMFPQVANAGSHIMIDATTYYVYGEQVPSITRTTLDRTQEEEEVFEHLGLTWSEGPDGTLYYDYAVSSFEYWLAARDPNTGEDTLIWDCASWLAQYQEVSYWACAANTARYVPETDTVLYSMFRTSTVAEIDLASGTVLRHMGEVDGDWSFSPEDSAFSLQHWANYTPEGTLMVSTHAGEGEQRIREFALDEDSTSLVEIWSWGEDSPYYADYAGEAYRRETGHVVHGLGTDGVLLELDGDDVVWGIAWHDELVGHATLVDDLYALNEGW